MHNYSLAQLDFLRAGYRIWKILDLTAFFNAWFRLDLTAGQIKATLRRHRIVSGREAKDRLINRSRLISLEGEQYLREEYRRLTLSELTGAFNARFGLQLSELQIKCFLKNHGIRSGRTGCFESGNMPWNTGTKGKTSRNKTTFVVGNVPANRMPLYHERIGKDGYIEIKVPQQNPYTGHKTRYRMKHVWLYEQQHGPVPRDMVVYFKDGDKTNFDQGNLGTISRAVLLVMNLHNYRDTPDELKPSVLALAKLEDRAGVRSRPGRGRKKEDIDGTTKER